MATALPNYPVVDRHIGRIRAGDTILCEDGEMRTVCPKDIRHCSFMGTTLRGDSYHSGHKPVKVVLVETPLPLLR